jgi:hypothetical protein
MGGHAPSGAVVLSARNRPASVEAACTAAPPQAERRIAVLGKLGDHGRHARHIASSPPSSAS